MSWGLGWKRPSDSFHLTLSYGSDDGFDDASPSQSRSSTSPSSSPLSPSSPTATSFTGNNQEHLGFRIDLDWTAGEDEDQVALRLQSQVMVALPSPQDTVEVELKEKSGKSTDGEDGADNSGNVTNGHGSDSSEFGVGVEMRVVKRKEPLKGALMFKAGGSGHQSDGMGVFTRLMRSNFANGAGSGGVGEGVGVKVGVCAEHWKSVTAISLCALGLCVSASFPYFCKFVQCVSHPK